MMNENEKYIGICANCGDWIECGDNYLDKGEYLLCADCWGIHLADKDIPDMYLKKNFRLLKMTERLKQAYSADGGLYALATHIPGESKINIKAFMSEGSALFAANVAAGLIDGLVSEAETADVMFECLGVISAARDRCIDAYLKNKKR